MDGVLRDSVPVARCEGDPLKNPKPWWGDFGARL